MARQNSPNKNRAGTLPVQNSPCSPKIAQFCAFCPRMANFLPLSPPTSHTWRTISRTHPPPGRAGWTFSRTGHSHVATMQPMTPLRPLMQASMKPPSPLHAPEQQPLKPPSPLQPKTQPKHPFRTRKGDGGFSRGSAGARKGDRGFRQAGRLVCRAQTRYPWLAAAPIGGIALHEGSTRRRHATSGLRVVQNPHRLRDDERRNGRRVRPQHPKAAAEPALTKSRT